MSTAIVALAGCTPDPGIVVDLRTNLAAGVDYQEARFHVEGAEPATAAELHTVRRPVNTSDGRDLRIGEVIPLPVGRYWVAVELWTSFETRVAIQRIAVTVDQLTAVTILISADCAGIVCPGAGDGPEATYCLSARCVPETCREDPTRPECPEPECTSDAECSATAACAEGRCIEGACFVEPLDERCGAGATCHIERGCLEAPTDGGTTCTPGSCDDFNPCTDDVCGETGCEASPNAAPCDDGIFCNGADTCSGGTCAVHAGSPCGMEMCSEGAGTCAACLEDADCPAASTGPFGACVFGDACAEMGTRTRQGTTWACDDGACRPSMTPENEACARDTDGVSCGATETGAFGACDYADACDETASRSRDVTRYACGAGTCQSTTAPEAAPCTRVTGGTECRAPELGGWDACEFTDVCDDTGTRTRDVTTYACAAGSCGSSTSEERESCTRSSRNGIECAPPVVGVWGACGYSDVCDESAMRSRTVTTHACLANVCRPSSGPESEACSRSTGGMACDDGAYCNGVDTCGGGSCTSSGDPCAAGSSCDEADDACWAYGNDGVNCFASAYYELGFPTPSPPGGYSQYSPPAGCAYSACTTFCQDNYCMPCPGGSCAACPF